MSFKKVSVLIAAAMVISFIIACKPTTPRQFIQPDEMEDLLVEYHMTRALAQSEQPYHEQDYRKKLYWESVLSNHNLTQAEFDSSLVYYYTRADRFEPIYRRVLNRLQDQAVVLGASEGEIGRYTALTNDGDTANIWKESQTLLLMPMAPFHRYEFEIVDTTFRAGDTFLMQFMSDYVYQAGSKDGILYVAVDYPDTTIVRHTRYSFSGLNQLRLVFHHEKSPERIRGFFHLGGSNDPSTTLRLLFVNNIQLIRFHTKHESPATAPTNSVEPNSAPQQPDVETRSSGDKKRKSSSVSETNRRTPTNRMVERIDSLKARN